MFIQKQQTAILRDLKGGVQLPGTSRDSKRGSGNGVSLYGSSVRGNRKEGSITGNSESQILSVLRDRLEHSFRALVQQ